MGQVRTENLSGDAVRSVVDQVDTPCPGVPETEDDQQALLLRASELLRADLVPDAFWSEIGDRCIACTGCNLVAPWPNIG